MSEPSPPRAPRRDPLLVESLRGVGSVVVIALTVVAVGGLLAVAASWLF